MGAQQLWFGIILTAGMAGTGLVSAWRQVLVLRNDRETMPAAAFFRAQAFRRLFCSLLLIAPPLPLPQLRAQRILLP